MKTVDITINVGKDGFFAAYCAENPAIFGGGESPEAAIEDLKTTLSYIAADGKDKAQFYPEWLDEDYEFNVRWDVETMLRYYSGIITPTALSKLSGIHPKQLWSYMHGRTRPRKAQVIRIEQAIHQLGRQLISITF